MPQPGDTIRSPRGTVVEILDNRPERFALRRTLPAGTGRVGARNAALRGLRAIA